MAAEFIRRLRRFGQECRVGAGQGRAAACDRLHFGRGRQWGGAGDRGIEPACDVV